MEWLQNHGQDILSIVGAVILIASTIVKLTPSQRDDAILAKVIALLNHFSVFNPNGVEVKKGPDAKP